MKVENGKRYKKLTLKHGTTERELRSAKVVSFEADGETRWYAEVKVTNPDTLQTMERQIGFLPEHVLAAE